MNIKHLWTRQSAMGLRDDAVDGKFVPIPRGGADHAAGHQTPYPQRLAPWPAERQAMLYLQVLARWADFPPGNLDRLWGRRRPMQAINLPISSRTTTRSHHGARGQWHSTPMTGC